MDMLETLREDVLAGLGQAEGAIEEYSSQIAGDAPVTAGILEGARQVLLEIGAIARRCMDEEPAEEPAETVNQPRGDEDG